MLAKRQDYDSFYKDEILTRKLMVYPPYCDICMVSVQSLNREIAENTVNQIFENIKSLIESKYNAIKSAPPYSTGADNLCTCQSENKVRATATAMEALPGTVLTSA